MTGPFVAQKRVQHGSEDHLTDPLSRCLAAGWSYCCRLILIGELALVGCTDTLEPFDPALVAMEQSVTIVMIPQDLIDSLEQLAQKLEKAPQDSRIYASARPEVEQFDNFLRLFPDPIILGNYFNTEMFIRLAICMDGLDKASLAEFNYLVTVCRWHWRYGDSAHLMSACPLLVELLPCKESNMPELVRGEDLATALESLFIREGVLQLKNKHTPRPSVLRYYSDLLTVIRESDSIPINHLVYKIDPRVRRAAISLNGDEDLLGVGGFRGIREFAVRADKLASN